MRRANSLLTSLPTEPWLRAYLTALINLARTRQKQKRRALPERAACNRKIVVRRSVSDGVNNLDYRRSDDHCQHRGQDEEHQWKENLDGGLLRRFFRA